MAEWQFVQIVDAIQNLLMMAKAPVAGAGASRCLAGALRSTTRKGLHMLSGQASQSLRQAPNQATPGHQPAVSTARLQDRGLALPDRLAGAL